MRKLDMYSQGDNSNTNHPYSLLTNTQGGVDGTTTDANQINDPMYALYAVLNKAGITPNNNLESVANSQFLQALTILIEETQLQPYKAGKTYNVGDTFTIGGVTHIVIPEADGLTAKFSDAVGAFAGLTTAQETALANRISGYTTSLKAGYERFRAEAVPLHLYEKGISSPVVDGIDLTAKYPKFFANCNGLNASSQYNTSRKAFIDDNLSYLVTGGVYKTFDMPQGFGIVNAFNDASIGSLTGGIAHDTVADNHLINNVGGLTPITYVSGNGGYGFSLPIYEDSASGVNIYPYDDLKFQALPSQREGYTEFTFFIGGGSTVPNAVVFSSQDGQHTLETSKRKTVPKTNLVVGKLKRLQYDASDVIDKAWFDLHPNTGAGLQLGYYTLLKMV